eukprot:5987776-Pyramimonas_sp.AAC.1
MTWSTGLPPHSLYRMAFTVQLTPHSVHHLAYTTEPSPPSSNRILTPAQFSNLLFGAHAGYHVGNQMLRYHDRIAPHLFHNAFISTRHMTSASAYDTIRRGQDVQRSTREHL